MTYLNLLEFADTCGLKTLGEAALNWQRAGHHFGDTHWHNVFVDFKSLLFRHYFYAGWEAVLIETVVKDQQLEWYYRDAEAESFGVRSLRKRNPQYTKDTKGGT